MQPWEPVELTAENAKISNAYSYVDPEAKKRRRYGRIDGKN